MSNTETVNIRIGRGVKVHLTLASLNGTSNATLCGTSSGNWSTRTSAPVTCTKCAKMVEG